MLLAPQLPVSGHKRPYCPGAGELPPGPALMRNCLPMLDEMKRLGPPVSAGLQIMSGGVLQMIGSYFAVAKALS